MFIQARVRNVTQETPEVKSFEFVRADGGPLPSFSAGGHVDVQLRNGLIRQYSLCNGPADTDAYLIGVKREPASRGGSATLHDQVAAGDLLMIGEPRNHFPVVDAATHHLLLGAGIGLTPLLSMARHLAASAASFELHVFARSENDTPFRRALEQSAFSGKVRFHLGLDAQTVRMILTDLVGTRPDGAHLYHCGPRPFMDSVRDIAARAWPGDAVHHEYFSASESDLARPRSGFTVRVASSGAEYVVPPDMSIVQVLAQHGVEVFTSCEQGVCGSCLTGVISGTPDHRDSYLSDGERQCGDKMMPCVSRSSSDVLVLDL